MKMRENNLLGVFLNAARVVGAEEDAHKSGVALLLQCLTTLHQLMKTPSSLDLRPLRKPLVGL